MGDGDWLRVECDGAEPFVGCTKTAPYKICQRQKGWRKVD